MAAHIAEQGRHKFRAWLPVTGVLLLLGFIPGMPNLLFILGYLFSAAIAFYIHRGNDTEAAGNDIGRAGMNSGAAGQAGGGAGGVEETESQPDRIELSDITDHSAVSIQLGYGLIEMVDEEYWRPAYQPYHRYPQTDFPGNLALSFQLFG